MICHVKSDSVASIVHNNSFGSTTRCVFLCWIHWHFLELFRTIIDDLYTNKVNCVKHGNKTKMKKITPCEPSRFLRFFFECFYFLSFFSSYFRMKVFDFPSIAHLNYILYPTVSYQYVKSEISTKKKHKIELFRIPEE